MCSPSSRPVALKWGHLAMSGDILGCHNWRGERVLLVPGGGGRPEMLLGILQHPEEPPSKRNCSAQTAIIMLRAETSPCQSSTMF